MSNNELQNTTWSKSEVFFFRVFFIYFTLQIVPFPFPFPDTIKFYERIFQFNWANLTFHDIRHIGAYHLNILKVDLYGSDFTNLFIVFGISVAAAFVWGFLQRNVLEYNNLYYWLKVAVRYKLAAIMFAYGFIKIFPMQFPDPTVSQLHTYVGDLSITKFYWLSVGITKPFEVFSGSLELIAGFLLLYRRTTLLGAILINIVMANVELVNFAYDINVKVYGTVIFIMSLFLSGNDIWKLLQLIIFQRQVVLHYFYPVFSRRFNIIRWVLKGAYLFFFAFLYFLSTWKYYQIGGYRYSPIPGVVTGFYEVEEFKWNNQIHPYSLDDTLRWDNVAFEKWNSLSIKSRRPYYLPYDVTQFGRDFYSYKADTVNHILHLEFKLDTNRNFTIHYSIVDSLTVLLDGKINQDSVFVKLRKNNRPQVLHTTVDERRKILQKRTQGDRWIQ